MSPSQVSMVSSISFDSLTENLQQTSIELHAMKTSLKDRMALYIDQLQNQIVVGLETLEMEHGGEKFQRDAWQREASDAIQGYGCTAVIQKGKVFDKGGVNTSILTGMLPPPAIEQMRKRGHALPIETEIPFSVAGLSMVIHPKNPMAPTMHQNYRYFEVQIPRSPENECSEETNRVIGWFGGGADLTPTYLFEEDALHFHTVYAKILSQYNPFFYSQFKTACDDYFYITHRQEHRGIGGIFFDDLEDNVEETFQWIMDCGNATLEAYLPILRRRVKMKYTEEQNIWKEIRRGRYVEFNIMYDRGTKFGLATPNPRVESILMTLPLVARWEYEHQPEKGSWEEKTLQILKHPKQWIEPN